MSRLEEDTHFPAILEECCRRVQRGESLERCLADCPERYREELSQLVPVAANLERLRSDPTPEFVTGFECELLAAVDQERRAHRVSLRERVNGLLPFSLAFRTAVVALVAVVVLAVGGIGVDRVSADSLPDSPLYQVKTAREWVQLVMARDNDARVTVQGTQIAERGRELALAVYAGKPRQVVATLALRLARTTEKMVDQALELQSGGKPQAANRALVVIRAMERELERLGSRATTETLQPLRRLQRLLEEQEQRLLGQTP